MKKVVIGLLLLGAIVAFGFIETAVQVYVKIFADLVLVQERKTETFVDGKLIDRKIDQQEIRKESWELWVMGSGTVIWSGETGNGKKTLVVTNYHVIEYALGGLTELKNLDSSLLILKRNSLKLEPYQMPKEAQFRLVIRKVSKPYLIFYWSWKRTNKQVYEVEAEIEKYDALLDIAILSLSSVVGLPYARFAKSVDEYPLGSEIVIFGAPLGVPFQLTRGVLGQRHLDAADGWYDLLRYDCPQAPGSSGSGIFTKDGLLLGVVRGSYVNMFGGAYDGQHFPI